MHFPAFLRDNVAKILLHATWESNESVHIKENYLL